MSPLDLRYISAISPQVSSAEAIWERFHLKGLGSKRQHALDRHLSRVTLG